MVGHNIFILAVQLARHSQDLTDLLISGLNLTDTSVNATMTRESLSFYSDNTAQIEVVREDSTLENIIFPVPAVCQYLTPATKLRIFSETEQDDQGSKVPNFFDQVEEMYQEMHWQQELRRMGWLWWMAHRHEFWSSLAFQFAVIINMIVAFFFPWDVVRGASSGGSSVQNESLAGNLPGNLAQNFTQNFTENDENIRLPTVKPVPTILNYSVVLQKCHENVRKSLKMSKND